jgi:transcriptional regulator NrdR family protein
MSQKVLCAFCGHATKVLPWRSERYGEANRRRRECLHCHAVLETSETIDKVIRQPLKRPA